MPTFSISERKQDDAPTPFPCAICREPVSGHTALHQRRMHPGKPYWPRCQYHERTINQHIRGIRAALERRIAHGDAMMDAVGEGVEEVFDDDSAAEGSPDMVFAGAGEGLAAEGADQVGDDLGQEGAAAENGAGY